MKTIFSGVQSSGDLHIGNYIGAIKNWVELQKNYKIYACIVDLHAITVRQEPEVLHKNILNTAKTFIAAGLDPSKSVIFIQSHIPAHTELAWMFTTLTKMSEMERMTQFKDKSKKKAENLNIGLFSYPVLMAADILLYHADLVPVGEDQTQHLEFARTIGKRFNNAFGEIFKLPEQYTLKEGARIMGLNDASIKMSKSAPSPNNYISLNDNADTIRKKIKKAVTDSGSEIIYSENKPALKNLLTIYSSFSGKKIKDLEKKYVGKGYSDFKTDLGELLVEKLAPIQEKVKYYDENEKELLDILEKGATTANAIASKTLDEAKGKMGFVL